MIHTLFPVSALPLPSITNVPAKKKTTKEPPLNTRTKKSCQNTSLRLGKCNKTY